MAVNVRIDRLEVGTLNVSPEAFPSGMLGDLLRGASPETLEDAGHNVPAGVPESPIDDGTEMTEQDLQKEISRLHDLAEATEPIADHIKPYTRRSNLLKARLWAGKLRMMEGAVTTHQETAINDIDAVENALENYTDNFKRSLAKACARCAFHGACSIENNPMRWLKLHPDESKVTRKEQESLQQMEKALEINPMYHCIPAKNRSKSRLICD